MRVKVVLGVVAGLVVLGVLGAGIAVASLRAGDRTLSGVEVAGIDVGDLTEAEVRERVSEVAARQEALVVAVTGAAGAVASSRGAVGVEVDVDGAVDQALRGGRGPLGDTFAYLAARRRGEPVAVQLEEHIDEDAARRFAQEAAEALGRDPVEADLEVVVAAEPFLRATSARAGVDVDEAALADRLLAALAEVEPVELPAPEASREPVVGEADLDLARARAEWLVRDAIALANPVGGDAVDLLPAQLAEAAHVERVPDAEPGARLQVRLAAERLGEVAAEQLAGAAVDPVDASITLEAGAIVIGDSADGAVVDVEATAAEVLAMAEAAEQRAGELVMVPVAPDRSREDAEALGIVEPVASFTTRHACCRNRVHNIQRMADAVRGAVLEPGDRFSLNGHVGPRTTQRGYRLDQMILDGEFVDVAGGGVSQFATTLFNAAFFAGVDLVEFRPHSQYISRYPLGREATVSWGSIDLVFDNDTDYGILIDTSYTSTSITVTFWSTEHLDVTTTTSPRRYRDDGSFAVTFTRTITRPDGEATTESWSHRYQPNTET